MTGSSLALIADGFILVSISSPPHLRDSSFNNYEMGQTGFRIAEIFRMLGYLLYMRACGHVGHVLRFGLRIPLDIVVYGLFFGLEPLYLE